ncbi:MAG: protein-L-isoaspartate(D-aspartate) O-methyltransferase [Chloroflexota bacterium]
MTQDELRSTRKRMVDEQILARGVRNPRLLAIMELVPRHLFIPPDELAWAYSDEPLPIGGGQTISQPYIVALMTELLGLKPTDRVLEIGTGCGYQAAVLSELAAEVHSIEILPELATQATKTLADLGYTNVHIHTSDGSFGCPETAPYDGILVAAAAPSVPQPLLDQLAEGGRLVVPVGNRSIQNLEVWKRTGQEFTCQKNLAVCFVPLRGEFGWR